ncbi:roadblock/LC7 domain-containing protein [Nocardiopsis alkaliphila]|uniref:roadblock/LC7 domain-containing protein n=1 Tax=Nocardiopsis alkaliphila TaxID=225762 RepID=UPI000349A72F|nr:roadblock/LC7 domain-containing protein [Nocardiopsis alkaliphila]
MVGKSKAAENLDWLLDDLVDRVVGAGHAIVLSADGLLLGRSRGLGAEDAEHLSALASAFQSLARGTGRHFGGGDVRQTVVEMERSYLFVTAAGEGACLAVLAAEDADVGLVAYEMNLRVKRVGQFLTAAPRQPDHLTPMGGAGS